MHKAWWWALAGVLACGDGTIGTERCVGTVCDNPGFMLTPLVVGFEEVPTNALTALPKAAWTIPNPCVGGPCTADDRTKLFSAMSGRAWNVVRRSPQPTVELIESDGTRTSFPLGTPLGGGSNGPRSYLVGQSDGTLLSRVIWPGAGSGLPVDEVALYAGQPAQRRTFSPAPQTRPLGAIRAAADGYLIFDADVLVGNERTGTVRVVGPDGITRWKRDSMPDVVSFVGGSAVWNTDQYVITARNLGQPISAEFALTWWSAEGVLQRGTTIQGATWRTARVYDQGAGRFVAVASSDLQTGGVEDDNTGHIDIVSFEYEVPVRGMRLMRSCFHKLAVKGFSIDAAGNMFITSIVGDGAEPRGLLCRVPATGVARCFQSEPRVSFGEVAAIGPSSVIVAVDDELARYDLP